VTLGMREDSDNCDQKSQLLYGWDTENMQPIHPIRLHGPWRATVTRVDFAQKSTAEIGADDSHDTSKISVGQSTKLQIPCDWGDWLGHDFCGVVSFVRAFGLPTNLDDQQEIWLVIEAVDFRGEIWLNEKRLDNLQLNQPPLRCPVRHCLQARNCLRIEIEMPAEVHGDSTRRAQRKLLAGGLIGSVRLEIV
jgi:hypothetical protein